MVSNTHLQNKNVSSKTKLVRYSGSRKQIGQLLISNIALVRLIHIYFIAIDRSTAYLLDKSGETSRDERLP